MWDDEGGNLPGHRLTLPTTRLWNQEVLIDRPLWHNYDPGDVREPSGDDSALPPRCRLFLNVTRGSTSSFNFT